MLLAKACAKGNRWDPGLWQAHWLVEVDDELAELGPAGLHDAQAFVLELALQPAALVPRRHWLAEAAA
jgi:hypothetical protein